MGMHNRFHPARTLRAAIQDLKPLEALEVVLAAYEDVAGTEDEALEAGRKYRLRPSQSLMFALMQRNMGKLVTFAALATVQESARLDPEPVSPGTTAVQICDMRDRLRGRFTIKNVRGAGYVLHPVGVAPFDRGTP